MTFYIRPRQDYSLARMSKILYVLHRNGIPHNPTLVIDPVTQHTELRISLSTLSKQMAEMYVELICKESDAITKDFKIVEMSE